MKKIVRFGAIVLIALATIAVVGCDFLLAVTMSVSGKAVNVLAEVTTTTDEYWKGETASGSVSLVGAQIKLTSLKSGDTTYYSTTVDSSGNWLITGITAGKYNITGTQTGWTFIPMDVEVSGFLSTVSADVLAYPTPEGDPIMLIVRWNNELIDVDSHLVIDSDGDIDTSNSEDTVKYSGAGGVVLNTAPIANTVRLDRDVRFSSGALNGYPVETIRILSNPFGASQAYDGQLRYYLESYSYLSGATQQTNNQALTGNPDATFTGRADATVYVMQGTVNFGTWIMPIDTAEKTLGVIKIDVVGNGTTTNYTIKSFGNEGSVKSVGITPVVVDAVR